jgi:uncharacterized protein (TIGR03086 family)
MIDLTPACQRTSDVLMKVTDEQHNGPTSCQKLSLRDLVAHVGGLALAFTAAARKEFGELIDTPPVQGVPVDEDWRTAYPARLAELARAWGEPAAWEGMSRAEGPVEGLFGPAVTVADDAKALDRVVALSGRDPARR